MSDWRPAVSALETYKDEVDRQRLEVLHLRKVVLELRARISELERGSTPSNLDV